MITWWHNFQRKRFYKTLFRNHSVNLVFDVGANQGVKSQLFLALGKQVVAVEPMPDCARHLQEMTRKYRELKVVQAAVSEKIGGALLQLGNHHEISTLSSKMVAAYTVPGKVSWNGTLEVVTTTLDELFSRFGRPDFLKLDCEGHDHVILKTLHEPLQIIEFEFLEKFTQDATIAVSYLTTLAEYRFNFCPFESASWSFSDWKSAEEFNEWLVTHAPTYIHGNIFAKKVAE